jgi:hypothetical protein
MEEQWKCSDHTPLVQTVGRIEAKVDLALKNQDEFRDSIDILAKNGVNERATIAQIQKPIVWARRILLGTLGAIGILAVQSLFPKLIKWLAGTL